MSDFDKITRRRLLWRAAQAGGAVAVGAAAKAADQPAPTTLPAHGVWDVHVHLARGAGSPEQGIRRLLHYADRMGIERLVVSMGMLGQYDPPPEEFRRQNDETLRAMRCAPDRVLGFVYLNPKHGPESLRELDRCVRDGPMVGIKLWMAVRCNDPLLDAIARRAVELKVPILQHTYVRVTGPIPGESSPADVAELAMRNPQATLIAAHTGCDWEQGVRAIRATRNVLADICGSDPTAGMVEMAVRELGAERVLFGSDAPGRSFASQLAKVVGADLPDAAKDLILGANARRLLASVLAAKGGKA